MEKKRKRVFRSHDIDDEDDGQQVGSHERIVELICESHTSTIMEIKTEINSAISAKTNELKNNIQESRETELYVAKKHADQASMLRTLNKELRDERSLNEKLVSENAVLQYQQGRHDAFQDCVGMVSEILEELQTIKNRIKAMEGGMKSIENKIKTIQDKI
jgi:hypothetical protein